MTKSLHHPSHSNLGQWQDDFWQYEQIQLRSEELSSQADKFMEETHAYF
jgi:hypothetical protein